MIQNRKKKRYKMLVFMLKTVVPVVLFSEIRPFFFSQSVQ